MKGFVFCALVFASSSTTFGASTSLDQYSVQTIDFDVAAANPAFSKILEKDGMIAMTNVPGLAEARQEAFAVASQCFKQAPANMALEDGTIRYSWAAFTDKEFEPSTTCQGLEEALKKLRFAVDVASKAFVQQLDKSVRVEVFDQGLLRKMDGDMYSTFEALVGESPNLDHLHVYDSQESHDVARGATLEMHTDQGLFIALVPSISFNKKNEMQEGDDSFVVELEDLSVQSLRFPNKGNVVLFMIGDGFNYLNANAHLPARPVPHALWMKNHHTSRRAWFGRMFFAPKQAVLNAQGDTFQSMIETVVQARRQLASPHSLSCYSATNSLNIRRDLTDSLHNCSAGTQFCWMACRSTVNVTQCAGRAECRSADGSIWQDCPTCHDRTAKLVCPSSALLGKTAATSLFGVVATVFAIMVWF